MEQYKVATTGQYSKTTLEKLKFAQEYLLNENNYKNTISAIEDMLVYPLDNLTRVNNSVFSCLKIYNFFIQHIYNGGYYVSYDGISVHIYHNEHNRKQKAIASYYKKYFNKPSKKCETWGSKIDLYYRQSYNKKGAQDIPVGEYSSLCAAVAILGITRYYYLKCPLLKYNFSINQLKKINLKDIIQYYIGTFRDKNIINNPQYLLCYLLEMGVITDGDIDTFNADLIKFSSAPDEIDLTNNSFARLFQKTNDMSFGTAVKMADQFSCDEINLASTNLVSYLSDELLLDIEEMYMLKNVFLGYESEKRGCSKSFSQALKYLVDFSSVLHKRYEIVDCLNELTWHFFCRAAINKYAQKWQSTSTVGEIGKLSIDKYINLCLSNGLLPIGDINNEMNFIYYLLTQKHRNVYTNFSKELCYELKSKIAELRNAARIDSFEKLLFSENTSQSVTYCIDDIDLMDGLEFEEFLAKLFNKMGYTAEVTKSTGDQGIDVIAERNNTKLGIQAKCYSGSVGNAAVQEAVAGKQFYNLDKVIVITNSHFTESAIALAKSNGVILWDREILSEKLHFLCD